MNSFLAFYAFLSQPCLYGNDVHIWKSVRKVIVERERLWKALKTAKGRYSLKDISVLISDISNKLPPGFVRALVGTWEENDTLLADYLKILETGE